MLKDLRMKIGLWLLGLLLIIVAVTIAQTETSSYLPMVFGPDLFFTGPGESEPNNSFSEANGPLRPDFVYSGLPNDPDDFFFFEAGDQGTITIDVLAFDASEGQVSLYHEAEGSAPELVASTNSPPPDFHLELSRASGGKYYIVVHAGPAAPLSPAALQSSSATPYSLQVSYLLPVTPTPSPEPTSEPTAGPSPTSTSEPTRDDITTTPTPTLEPTQQPTDQPTPGASPTPTEQPTRSAASP
jgi:hypothetical protein